MKKITLQIGLTMAMFILNGAVYSQTVVNNLVRLVSLNAAAGGTNSTSAFTDDSVVTISAAGAVTIGSDFTPTATSGNTTGTVTLAGALDKSFTVRYRGASLVNTTAGPNFGEVTTDGGIVRSSTGDIGVQIVGSAAAGIDVNEGLNFGLDLTNLPANLGVQINAVQLSSFSGASGLTVGSETALVINRQDTSKTLGLTQTINAGANGGSGIVRGNTSSLGVIIPGGTLDLDAITVLNNSSAAHTFRITGIELTIIVLNTTWNGTAWSNGNPGPAVDAIIEGNYSALAKGGFSAKTLTVNSGSLTLEATKSVKIENSVTNNAGPSGIIVENGGALVQVINSANANVGAITVNRNSNSLLRLDYTMWSSPVSGTQTLAQFSPLTSQSPNRFYTYDSATVLYSNVSPSTIFDASNAGKGFLIRMPNDASAVTATPYAGVFTGVPNSGPITLSGLTANKFYAVGNPYPSVLSAALFLAGNPLAGTTLYFWRKTNGTANTISGSSTGTAYATWTSLASTASGTVAPNDIAPSANIAVGQGFIVNTGTATSLNFTNTMRPNSSTATFLKTKATVTPDRIWLNLTNATGAFSQMALGYLDTATLGVDNGIDGEYINDSSLALTSNINNKEYTIQGRPTFDPSDVVALNFKTAIAGDYTIAIDHFDGLFAAGQDIYLSDSKTGAETNLKAGSYNFTAEAGVDNARFSLKYQKTLKVIDSEFSDNSITVYVNNGSLFVKSAVSAIQNIKVFDIQGRLIAEQRDVNSNTATISNLSVNQALILQVSSEDNKVVSKKVLN